MNNSGKIAIVTGGASGIGAALVRALASRGDTVIIADINEAAAKAAAGQLAGLPGTTTAVAVDVQDAGAVDELVQRVAADHGRAAAAIRPA